MTGQANDAVRTSDGAFGRVPARVAIASVGVGCSLLAFAILEFVMQLLFNVPTHSAGAMWVGLPPLMMTGLFSALGYAEPPEVLSAADQFELVQDLLQGQDPSEWPAYGHLLTLRRFADQIRQLLLRAQEARITPEEIQAKAEYRGLSGWLELARFARAYLDVLVADRVVDFAALIGRAEAAAAASEPLLDHLLVDDYHDATFAQEPLVRSLRTDDVVVAADPEAHVFSFQGTTAVPALRFTQIFAGA